MHFPLVHLRLHSEYSIEDGLISPEAAVERAVKFGMPALALSDTMNLFGLVKFYKAARAAGVKPIVACDVWLAGDENAWRANGLPSNGARLTLIARDQSGYRQLCALLSRAYLDPQRRGKVRFRRAWLTREACSGLLALSGARDGVLSPHLLAGDDASARAEAQHWAMVFPNAFYVEVQRAGFAEDEPYLAAAVPLAAELGLPVVATHPVQFLEPEDYTAHEVRFCIANGYVLNDPKRPRPFTEEQYFLSPEEMLARFSDLPEALENTLEIAKRANVSLTLGKPQLPVFPTPPGMTLDEFLIAEAKRGLEKRLEERFPDPEERERRRGEYEARLAFECNTIVQMGFSGYFLIVADFINWAKNHGVPVGPGRGSGAGSLVAYALRITDLDPLQYALLFERFLNPERVSMPDFDVDFCQDKRYQVIEYVRERYGAEAVSQIATFGTMASKAVVRDVGRVLGLPYSLCDRISKLIPVEGVKPVSLAKALELEPQLKAMMEDPQDGEAIAELFRLAQPLEGLVRNVGMHAGGVLIAPGKITDFCPLYLQEGEDASPVSQFDKDDVEAIGLVKFDFLGLRNLTIIREAEEHIERMTGARPDWTRIGFEDEKVYALLKAANTTAVFQLESEGMKKLLAKLQPDRFEDIIAVLALYRPGPLGSGMVDDFILRKQGKQSIDYFHPDLEACLAPTYGVIVYQEQVMQIAQIMGGYTLGAADLLRRAMGKKKPEEMAKHREIFRRGAVERGYDEQLALRLFDLMEKFAEYGFNKSHTAAYAVVTYQTAWLKAHHPAAFYAATLSSDMDDTDAVKVFVEDARQNGITLLPPDVNASDYRFMPVDAATLRYGLGAIKGVGQPAAEAIVAARRAQGPYRDLFDLVARVDRRVVNRRVLEALVRAGALDTLPGHEPLRLPTGTIDRARLLASIPLAMEAAEQQAAAAMQGSLFDEGSDPEPLTVAFAEARPWSERERLKEEKAALGYYFSGHPFQAYARELRRTVPATLDRLEPSRDGVVVCGVVMVVRSKMGNRGRMAFVTLDDATSAVDVLFYSETFDAYRTLLQEDAPLVVRVRVTPDEYSGGVRLVAEEAYSLAQWRARQAKCLSVRVALPTLSEAAAQQMVQVLDAWRGEGLPLEVWLEDGEGIARWLAPQFSVRAEDDLLLELIALPGITAAEWRYENEGRGWPSERYAPE